MPVEERDGYGIAPRAELPRRLLAGVDPSAAREGLVLHQVIDAPEITIDGAPLQEALESLRAAVGRMGEAALRASEGMYETSATVQTHADFLRDETRLQVVFRPVAGLPTEAEQEEFPPVRPGCDQMRWTPPAACEEVPRWLA